MMQTQRSCGGVVIRFVIYLCLVGFSAAAKCVPEKCGAMEVSYPFWIKKFHCGFPGFQIYCRKDEDIGAMAPFLRAEKGSDPSSLTPDYYKIREIDYMGHLTVDSTSLKTWTCRNYSTRLEVFQLPLDGPFTISMLNRFVVVGCKTIGSYAYGKWGQARCISTCYPPSPQTDPPYCRYGCCEITLPDNWKWIHFTGGGEFDQKCGFSTILYPSTFKVLDNNTSLFWGEGRKAEYDLYLNWGIGLKKCSRAKATANYSCSSNAECIDSPSWQGHICKCLPGYEGNGYSNGTDCTDIDECSDKKLNACVGAKEGGICLNLRGSYNCSCADGYNGDGYYNRIGCTDKDECAQTKMNMCVGEEEGGICRNLAGSHNCSCAKGYKGDGFRNGTGCKPEKSNKTVMFAAIGSVSASIGVSLGVCGLVWWLRKHYQKHASEENFRCNGGFLLREILRQRGNQTERKEFRIFSEDELKRASQNYSDGMKLGIGGSSTVYKGNLEDGTTVAIKKFKEITIGEEIAESTKQFLKEIVILWGLIHENVVSLVGCCLQTQSPLLVYGFVDGGTVAHHLRFGHLSWQSRLQIAMGIADALAYLHSELDHPIIHRGVKSSNILLDNSATPKLANFGLSWILCENDSHLKTNVQDTSGYMDPEFFRKGKLTEKSDVYSFGIFLVELLTGREPLSTDRPQDEMVLSDFFLSKYKDHNCLIDILDLKLKNGENRDQMTAMADLATECLRSEGSKRPPMKEVKMKLEGIGGSKRLHV